MSLSHCDKCHHEWEGPSHSKCDWCGSSGYILELETSLERCIKAWEVIGEDFKSIVNIEKAYDKMVK